MQKKRVFISIFVLALLESYNYNLNRNSTQEPDAETDAGLSGYSERIYGWEDVYPLGDPDEIPYDFNYHYVDGAEVSRGIFDDYVFGHEAKANVQWYDLTAENLTRLLD